MRVIDKTEFDRYKQTHLKKIRNGAVFIYPTDTIYGIGCDAANGDAIQIIRNLKKRPEQPFSVIVPSKQWILDNCVVPDSAKPWLEKLPGPYTLILHLKENSSLHKNVNPTDSTIGVRIPNHWISKVVAELGRPIITTSPNVHGEEVIKTPYDLEVEFRIGVDFAIEEGILHNPPSTVVKLTEDETKFLRGKPTN
jgi:tRNA threonylcarbamoyl adenosine modification protein (Sua5/YciO/YrdC/YwlC family)